MNKRERLSLLIQAGKEEEVEREYKNIQPNKIAFGLIGIGDNVLAPYFTRWIGKVKIASKLHFSDHPLINSLDSSLCSKNLDEILGYLEAIYDDEEYFGENTVNLGEGSLSLSPNKISDNKKVFIVHGHDKDALAKTENFVRKMDLEPIVLSDQANKGMTVIEKIEHYSDVGFSIILYTPCDKTDKGKSRARQNVVMEHGYLMGKLGRSNVVALVKGDIEIPSDISGVVYIPMDGDKAWEQAVAKDLRAAGYEADANRI